MKSAGHLVSATAEFSAGMKDRKDDLDSRKAGFMVDAYGDTAAVIDDRDAVSLVDDDLYFRTGP